MSLYLETGILYSVEVTRTLRDFYIEVYSSARTTSDDQFLNTTVEAD